jgi:hypothetical protein
MNERRSFVRRTNAFVGYECRVCSTRRICRNAGSLGDAQRGGLSVLESKAYVGTGDRSHGRCGEGSGLLGTLRRESVDSPCSKYRFGESKSWFRFGNSLKVRSQSIRAIWTFGVFSGLNDRTRSLDKGPEISFIYINAKYGVTIHTGGRNRGGAESQRPVSHADQNPLKCSSDER